MKVRILGAIGAALFAIAPFAFAQSGCANSELLGGNGGACVIEVTHTSDGAVRTYRPLGATDDTKPTVIYGVKSSTGAVGGVNVLRGAPAEPKIIKPAPKATCRYSVIRLSDRRDGDGRYRVCLDDVAKLETREGLEATYERLLRAATAACPKGRKRFTERGQSRCVRDAMDDAIYNSGLEQLALYHARRRTGIFRERLIIVGPE